MTIADLSVEERRVVRCAGCMTVLATDVAGVSVVTRRSKHGKTYEWVGYVLSMKCDYCGMIWRPVSHATDSGVNSH